ncbi:uncharacterized protein LOC128987319 [Macrosteles quadrilineatus]|uniref:uncharacterized protein LOC128987319 n=1 Tax=Macrosteles quadrilineatus TaxID=74068 RepID=UPI0023E196BA|nr:uncharacterized protein LOC128987319 [Macrosteles quadrilineatus]
MRSEHLINDTLLYTIKAEINNVCNTHPNMCSLAVPKGCTHDQQHVKSIAGLCSTKNIAVFMEEKHLSNNYMFSAVTQNVSFPTSTESNLIELLLNKTDNLACSIPSETQSDHYNKISSLESASSSTLSLFDENTENTTQLNLKSDQIVPSDFIENNQMALNLPTHEVMQSKFETSKNYTIQTASMITNSDKDLSGQNSTLKPCGLIEITTQNKIVLSLVNKIALNDFDGIPSKILSLLQPSPSNSNTTGIESYSDVGNRNQFSSPLESKFVDSPKNTTQINISHKTVDCKLVSKESNAVLNMRDSAISNILNVTQRNYAGSCDKDTVKPNNCNYNSLLNISKYDSSKENCDISEETFTELHEDEVLCNSPLPSNERTDVVEARDVDELDEVIDDSINRFENFTVDVGVLATPSIAEKSCQTELIGDDYVKCKRCLELDNCRSEPAKKPRIGLNEMLDLQYETRNTNYSYIDSKESQTQFITRDLPNIIERKCYSDHDITSRSNILIPNHLEAVQFTNVYPSVNNDIQLRLIEDIQGYHREGTDEIDEMEEDENYLFEEKKTDRSNKDESEQEVPSNATFNKEYPPPPPHPFVTPKKPVLRVGLPRSARFKPLHPRV